MSILRKGKVYAVSWNLRIYIMYCNICVYIYNIYIYISIQFSTYWQMSNVVQPHFEQDHITMSEWPVVNGQFLEPKLNHLLCHLYWWGWEFCQSPWTVPEESASLIRGSRVAYKKIFWVIHATVRSGCIKAKGFVDLQLQVAFCVTVLNPKW